MISKYFPMLIVLSVSAIAQAQQPPRPMYDRTEDCIGCHERPYAASGRKDEFVQDLPGTIWTHQDKHRQSFILMQRNQALVNQILGFDWGEVMPGGKQLSEDPKDRDRVERIKQCLRCHATWPKNDVAWEDERPQPPVELELGVSCQACHGPGLRWSRPHRETAWRLCSAESKTRLGMYDLRHPVRRALLCASCHVGSVDEGKFVTHDMYAGGHPPLPSFEYVAFSKQMPRHWRSFSEKGAFLCRDQAPAGLEPSLAVVTAEGIRAGDLKSSYRDANFPGFQHDPANDLEGAKGLLLSGLVVMRDYLKLLQARFPDGSSARQPEFAMFDCTACHHELRPESGATLRPKRLGLPGRPPLPSWPTTLARAALWQARIDGQPQTLTIEDFDRQWQDLEQSAIERPFGNPARIQATTTELIARLQARIVAVSRQPFDRASAERAWEFLTDRTKLATTDYHSARQTAWGLTAIGNHLGHEEAVSRLLLSAGKDPLQLTLPAGQSGNVLANLDAWSSAIADYKPDWFESVLVDLTPR